MCLRKVYKHFGAPCGFGRLEYIRVGKEIWLLGTSSRETRLKISRAKTAFGFKNSVDENVGSHKVRVRIQFIGKIERFKLLQSITVGKTEESWRPTCPMGGTAWQWITDCRSASFGQVSLPIGTRMGDHLNI